MTPRRWTSGHVAALVELFAGLVAAAWFIGLGIQAEAAPATGRSGLDRSTPFLLGAAVAVGLGAVAWRSWRAAERTVRESAPAPSPAAVPVPVAPPPAALSAEGRRELARIVDVLAGAGVLAPEAPDPAQLSEAVADYGEPVTAVSVLGAIAEADHYHPGFPASDYSANLAFHASHTEQLPDVLQDQVHDLVRLAGDGLADVTAVVKVGSSETGRVPTTLRLAVGGQDRVLAYAGAHKYLSTVLHAALAQVLRERRTGHRLAWLWSDQGVWLFGLADGTVESLNRELAGPPTEAWAWVDEQPPHAAGELYAG